MPSTVLGAEDKVAWDSLYRGLGVRSLSHKARGFATLASDDAEPLILRTMQEDGLALGDAMGSDMVHRWTQQCLGHPGTEWCLEQIK